MKNGIASREKDWMPLTIRWNSVASGMFKYSAVRTEEIPSVKEIGIRSIRKITKDPIMMAMAVDISGMGLLLSGASAAGFKNFLILFDRHQKGV